MASDVVSPKQQRSIEKRNKILQAGFKLFKQKGYYNTTTAEIAKEAGVSTGIVYRYFTDKKDIFIETMEQFYRQVYDIFIDNIKNINSYSELPEYLNSTIDYAISTHDMTKDVYEEIEALSHYDEDVGKMCNKVQEEIISILISIFPKLGLSPDHSHEKLHVILDLIDSYCEEVVYRRKTVKTIHILENL